MPDSCVLVLGLVSGSLGWLFNLIATCAPDWRVVGTVKGRPLGEVIHQGIWDICRQAPGGDLVCRQEDDNYFVEEVVKVAQGMMITSVILTGIAQILTLLGVRCWRRSPNLLLAGLGGVTGFSGGVFAIVPIAWYTNRLNNIKASGTDLRAGYCIILGFIGSCFLLIGGASLMTCLHEAHRNKKRRVNQFKTPRMDPGQRARIRTVDSQGFNKGPSFGPPRRSSPRTDS